jgi:hypothetical protein
MFHCRVIFLFGSACGVGVRNDERLVSKRKYSCISSWNLSTDFTDFVIVGHGFSLFSDFTDFCWTQIKIRKIREIRG